MSNPRHLNTSWGFGIWTPKKTCQIVPFTSGGMDLDVQGKGCNPATYGMQVWGLMKFGKKTQTWRIVTPAGVKNNVASLCRWTWSLQNKTHTTVGQHFGSSCRKKPWVRFILNLVFFFVNYPKSLKRPSWNPLVFQCLGSTQRISFKDSERKDYFTMFQESLLEKPIIESSTALFQAGNWVDFNNLGVAKTLWKWVICNHSLWREPY